MTAQRHRISVLQQQINTLKRNTLKRKRKCKRNTALEQLKVKLLEDVEMGKGMGITKGLSLPGFNFIYIFMA